MYSSWEVTKLRATLGEEGLLAGAVLDHNWIITTRQGQHNKTRSAQQDKVSTTRQGQHNKTRSAQQDKVSTTRQGSEWTLKLGVTPVERRD